MITSSHLWPIMNGPCHLQLLGTQGIELMAMIACFVVVAMLIALKGSHHVVATDSTSLADYECDLEFVPARPPKTLKGPNHHLASILATKYPWQSSSRNHRNCCYAFQSWNIFQNCMSYALSAIWFLGISLSFILGSSSRFSSSLQESTSIKISAVQVSNDTPQNAMALMLYLGETEPQVIDTNALYASMALHIWLEIVSKS
ncbi:hypothetical protein VNO77_14321 [Canavalia gladiata]|uniref:Uncharacterized protein n=1 Tax=Canavalia gladiata TaxID=3824 RepID=A0AAN9QQR1_CANGL